MQNKENLLQKIVSNTLIIGIGVTGTLFFVWLIKLLISAILK